MRPTELGTGEALALANEAGLVLVAHAVLAVVRGRADGPFSGRQVHRLTGRRSEPGIRKGVHRLVEQGIVLRRRVGDTNLHSLNRDHLAAEAIIPLAHDQDSLTLPLLVKALPAA